jgi:inosine/xanthosine triphosphate pyrophosphatase family protein
MISRKEMILALTKNELVFAVENPEQLDDVAQFFANGGFTTYTHDHLNQQYVLQIEKEKAND